MIEIVWKGEEVHEFLLGWIMHILTYFNFSHEPIRMRNMLEICCKRYNITTVYFDTRHPTLKGLLGSIET